MKELTRLALVLGVSMAVTVARADDFYMLGDRAGYAMSRVQGQSCFAVMPKALASSIETVLFASQPGEFRLPAQVKRVFDAGVSVARIGDDTSLCGDAHWPAGEHVETALGRTGIATLETGNGDAGSTGMYVRIMEIDPAGYFTISPVRESDRMVAEMAGRRVLLEDEQAGLVLEVDEQRQIGRVIRQDVLTRLVEPFFQGWVEERDATPAAVARSGPVITHSIFVGRQGWRNNPLIVGNRVFVGSAGRVRGEADALDGVRSFDLESGKQMWFVHTASDFNDLTYIKGLVIGGTENGEVLGVGARSGKTYWTRTVSGTVLARPVRVPAGVAIATSSGELSVLALKDGATKLVSKLDGPVTGGLAAGRRELWVATATGTLHRYVGFGEIQMRRDSSVYYPDELGDMLSGNAIDWYRMLGEGRGLRARFDAAPLVLDDRVVLAMVREGRYDYPPVIAFKTDGELGWIGTDPHRRVKQRFGNARLTPAAWYDSLILADPESNSIYSISRDTGEVLWATELGTTNFQLWSSPVVERDSVFIATYDGFLHKFRAKNGERVWSIYLGRREFAGRTFAGNRPLPDARANPAWSPELSSPILATPAIAGDTIAIGTDEGYLYIIKDH